MAATAAGVGAIVTTLVLSPVLRPWYSTWGATEPEVHGALPGDDLVPHPRLTTTRAITISAPIASVWPWLVQIGQGRGGLYSYELLENLIGCDIHNVDRVIPELQNLQPGDPVRLGPQGYPFYRVAAVERDKALVLQAANPRTGEPGTGSWAFVLTQISAPTTRLLIRSRTDYAPGIANLITWRIITDPLHFVMERKMLLTIKERAERSARGR